MSGLKVAVVGVGALGRHHARILGQMPEVTLAGVVDSHEDRGRQVATSCQTEWFRDYQELDGKVDAVSVVVPTVAHRTVAGYFLERGIPVLVEKPIASDLTAAQELVDLAHANHCLLQVGHIERFNPAWQAAQPLLRDPKYIKTERTSTYTFRSTDIGVVLDLMIHDLDLVLSVIQSPLDRVEAFGVGVMGDHEDAAQARLFFENGAIADLTTSRIHPTVARSVQSWSATDCLTIDLHQRKVSRFGISEALRGGPAPVELSRQPNADLEALKAQVFGHFVDVQSIEVPEPPTDALTQELTEFVRCLTTGGQPRVDGRQGLRAIAAAHRVLESIASHSWNGRAKTRSRFAA
jgi:predicted dehydrogenase